MILLYTQHTVKYPSYKNAYKESLIYIDAFVTNKFGSPFKFVRVIFKYTRSTRNQVLLVWD